MKIEGLICARARNSRPRDPGPQNVWWDSRGAFFIKQQQYNTDIYSNKHFFEQSVNELIQHMSDLRGCGLVV